MKLKQILRVCVFSLSGAALTALLAGQEPVTAVRPPAVPLPEDPESIQQSQPAFYVRAEVNHPTRTYREGEGLSVEVLCEVDAYVYALYRQAEGKVFQVFPNSAQPHNKMKGKEPVSIPAQDDLFRWRIGPPFGKEIIKVIATREPIAPLSHPAARSRRFNPIPGSVVKGVHSSLKNTQSAMWSECEIEIVTMAGIARPSVPVAPKARRFGVFFGVSKYEFHEEVLELTGKIGMNLNFCDADAKAASELLRQVGDITEVRLFLNEQVTRANLEDVITRWLPSVSRPGDTIVIYHSGHGGQISDDNGDEPDKLDEYLVTHDAMNAAVLAALLKRMHEGRHAELTGTGCLLPLV